jgi:hypothetical protein
MRSRLSGTFVPTLPALLNLNTSNGKYHVKVHITEISSRDDTLIAVVHLLFDIGVVVSSQWGFFNRNIIFEV